MRLMAENEENFGRATLWINQSSKFDQIQQFRVFLSNFR